jgi:serine/threonine protein kinase/osmotically-inducible protein OsmY
MNHPQRLGKYQITDVLGKGAMGVVYKAHDPDIQRAVAIKTIRRELVEDDGRAGMVMARFKNEARAAGRLSHPGIVAVYDYGEAEDVAFIAMEFVEGNSLRAYFGRETRFEERDVVSLMAQLLDALQHAHEQGVWHRDVKPANIIIMNSGKLKVADFGIARIDSSSLTQVGAVMGSPGYMAPEQYKGDTVDWRADIFAAGVMLYQLLTETRPFTGSAEQLAYKVCYQTPPPPSVVAPGRELERYDPVVAKALSKVPEERYASAADFKAAILEAYAEPVSPTISEETILNEPARAAGVFDPSQPSWQAERSSGWGSTPVPRSTGGDAAPPPRTLPSRSNPPSVPPGAQQSLSPERGGTISPTLATTQAPSTGTLAPAQGSRAGVVAWAVAGVAIAVAVGVVAWHAGRDSRVPATPPTEPIMTRTTELPAPPSSRPSGDSPVDTARSPREAVDAQRIAAAQARADREAAEAKARAERAAAEAREAKARAEREAAARRAAEAQARADAERARAIALQNRQRASAQQAASATKTEEERAREAELAAAARARAEAERARTASAAAAAPAPAAEPARAPSFFRDEAINLKVASKLQFNRELYKEQITADVSGGVVTLTGTVSTQAKRDLAGKVAGQVSGVVRVNNNLKVAGQ